MHFPGRPVALRRLPRLTIAPNPKKATTYRTPEIDRLHYIYLSIYLIYRTPVPIRHTRSRSPPFRGTTRQPSRG